MIHRSYDLFSRRCIQFTTDYTKKKKTIVLVCDDTDLINFQLRELRGYFNLRYFLSVTTRSKYQISCTRAQDF